MKKRINIILILIILLIIVDIVFIFHIIKQDDSYNNKKIIPIIKENKITSLTINAIGDLTIGSGYNFGEWNSFNSYLKNNDYSYYFKGVYDILSKDDLTIGNLEGTFTDSNDRAEKTFNFKNAKDYVNVLKSGSVEIVNVANNHTYDYKEKGYKDTLDTLDEANIHYYGYNVYKILDVKGIKIGFAGFTYFTNSLNYDGYENDVDNAVNYLKKENVDLIIMSFHWGIEGTTYQTKEQIQIGHYAIDKGVDLVLGHHPHRIQGIELYKDKYIVYSLANFVFGGNQNPKDKRSFIFQTKLDFINNKLVDNKVKLIPVSISGVDNLNNYQPILVDGLKAKDIIDTINNSSINFHYELT